MQGISGDLEIFTEQMVSMKEKSIKNTMFTTFQPPEFEQPLFPKPSELQCFQASYEHVSQRLTFTADSSL